MNFPWQQWIRTAGAAFFPPAVVFLAVPNTIILRNLDELSYDSQLISNFLILFLVSGLALWPLMVWGGRRPALGLAAKVFIAYGANVLLWDVLSLAYFRFDPPLGLVSILELSLFGLTLFAITRLSYPFLLRLCLTVALVLSAYAVIEHGVRVSHYLTNLSEDAHSPAETAVAGANGNAGAASDSRGGNVYHILFDSYQSQLYPYLLQSDPELRKYPLVLFDQFRTNSPSTWLSNAIMFWGRFYDGRWSMKKWSGFGIRDKLFGDLVAEGIDLHLYPFYEFYCHKSAASCKSKPRVASKIVEASHTIIDLWFLKILPESVKVHLDSGVHQFDDWSYGFSVTSFWGIGGKRDYRAYQSALLFQEMIDDEADRAAAGQYIFIHAMLPHAPLILGSHCEFRGRRSNRAEHLDDTAYVHQAKCANRLLKGLMAELERLGRLDNALIIVHSDHGFFFHPAEPGNPFRELLPGPGPDERLHRVRRKISDSSTWNSINIELRSAALMLVKLPGRSSSGVSHAPLQTTDIAPTILHHFSLPRDGYRGKPIQEIGEGFARDQIFFAFKTPPEGRHPEWLSEYHRINGKWIFIKKVRVTE